MQYVGIFLLYVIGRWHLRCSRPRTLCYRQIILLGCQCNILLSCWIEIAEFRCRNFIFANILGYVTSLSSLATMTGSVGIITDSEVLSFKVGETYHVGYLPWYHQIWQTISNYPLLLVLCALVCAVLVGGGIFYFMRLWIRRRS